MSASRYSSHTQRLADRATPDWQPLEPVLLDVMALVPPGKALRRYNARRETSTAKKTTDVTKPELTDTEKIASGARSYARDSVQSLKANGKLETRFEGGVEQFRRKVAEMQPGDSCPHCGHTQALDPTLPVVSTKPQLAKVIQMSGWGNRWPNLPSDSQPSRPSTSSS